MSAEEKIRSFTRFAMDAGLAHTAADIHVNTGLSFLNSFGATASAGLSRLLNSFPPALQPVAAGEMAIPVPVGVDVVSWTPVAVGGSVAGFVKAVHGGSLALRSFSSETNRSGGEDKVKQGHEAIGDVAWQLCPDLDAESKELLENVCKEAIARDAGTVAEDVVYSEAAQRRLQEPVEIRRKTIMGREGKPEVITRKEYLEMLVRDPDHNYEITACSIEEASAALTLEQHGLLQGPLTRKAGTDFVDKIGVEWNVKRAISKIPGTGHTFKVDVFIDIINKMFQQGENIIIDARNLEKVDMTLLQEKIKSAFSKEKISRIKFVI
jgi:hypothetical protein